MADVEQGDGEGLRRPADGVAILIGLNDFAVVAGVQHQGGRFFLDQEFDNLTGYTLIVQGTAQQGFQLLGIQWQHERSSRVIGSTILQAVRAVFAPARHRDEAKAKAMVKVLFVCMGNICRSPMAEGVFQRILEGVGLSEKVYVDSAGTHSYHIGAPPDMRSQATALRRGVDLRSLRARQVTGSRFGGI